jgi:hypothetical protein
MKAAYTTTEIIQGLRNAFDTGLILLYPMLRPRCQSAIGVPSWSCIKTQQSRHAVGSEHPAGAPFWNGAQRTGAK